MSFCREVRALSLGFRIGGSWSQFETSIGKSRLPLPKFGVVLFGFWGFDHLLSVLYRSRQIEGSVVKESG